LDNAVRAIESYVEALDLAALGFGHAERGAGGVGQRPYDPADLLKLYLYGYLDPARSFVACFCIILSMYGGGFSTVPAYLADMFGTQFVGAIHGRLLTAWSTAGIIGPVVVNYLREFQLAAGVPRDQLYNSTMYVLCFMLVVGLICNLLVKPVNPKWYMSSEQVAALQATGNVTTAGGSYGIGKGGFSFGALLFWAFVGIPLAWGVWITLENALKIF
jgi:hypothetical protein